MSIEAINDVSKMRFTNSTTKFVLMALANYADGENYCYPGQTKIAEFCSLSRVTANRHLKSLEDNNYIRSQQYYRDDGGKRGKGYWLTLHNGKGLTEDTVTHVAESYKGSSGELQEDVAEVYNPCSGELQGDVNEGYSNNHQERTVNRTVSKEPSIEPQLFESLQTTATAELLDPLDPKTFFDIYNSMRGALSSVTAFNDTRRRKLKKLIKEHGEDALPLWEDAIREVTLGSSAKWWTENNLNLDNLIGKTVEKAEKWRHNQKQGGGGQVARDALRYYEALKGRQAHHA